MGGNDGQVSPKRTATQLLKLSLIDVKLYPPFIWNSLN